LATRPGIDSGFMIQQMTAASLVSENKVLAHPACVDSIPTSANQEDHVSMGSISALKLCQIVQNVASVLGIELLIACSALDQREFPSSVILEKVKATLRENVAPLNGDRIMYPDVNKAIALVRSGLLEEICPEID